MRQTDDMQGSKTSNAPEHDSFAVPFIHLELKREFKEDHMNVGEGKVGKSLQLD